MSTQPKDDPVKKLSIIVSLAAALALASLGAFSARSQAANGISVDRFPVSFTLFNPCTNELVDLSGMAITVLDTTPEDNHFRFHSNDIGVKGIGQTTGARYVEVATISIVLQGEFVNGQFVEQNTIRNLRLITAGGGNNAVSFNITYHLTINANGDVALEFVHAAPEGCV
jgi:hypothetical protein